MKLNIEKASTPRVSARRLGEVLELMQLLWALDHGLQSTSKRMAVALGVTGPQRLVIRIVGQYPGISAGTLAEILCVHPSTLTGVLRRLESRRTLHRKQDPGDRRRALLTLTDKGRELDALRSGTVEAAVRRGLAKIPRHRLKAAREVLRVLATELKSDT
jgi:DNA-binding MarR family transcriptional regulator